MFRVLLVLALCGSGLTHAAPVQHEEYFYRGSIMAGVHNPRQTQAGSVITMTVKLDRQSDASAEVEFVDSKSCLFNEHIYIGDPPREEHDDSKNIPQLDGKFKVYFDRERGTVMEVPDDEKTWITNLRKGVVSMLKVPPYVGDTDFLNLEKNQFERTSKVSVKEERLAYFRPEVTFAGFCNVSYTMNSDYNDGHWDDESDHVLPEDRDKYYRLHRSIDFDSCHNPAMLQKTSTGNFSKSYSSQFEGVQERNLVGEYVLHKRDDGFFDIKGLIQIGSVNMKPFGQDTGRVATYTNQTLSLRKLSKGSSSGRDSQARYQAQERQSGKLQGENRKPITTWTYQFTSPAAPNPEGGVDWVVYDSQEKLFPVFPEYAIIGRDASSDEDVLNEVRHILDEIADRQSVAIEDLKERYNGTTDGQVAERLNLAARAIRSLKEKSIRTLHSETKRSKKTPRERVRRQSFLDASMASGSSAALKVMIDEAKAGNVDENRMAGHILTLVNNIYDPESISELMEYVMSLDYKTHNLFLMNIGHLNFAKLAQRVCVHRDLKRYVVPHDYLGTKICHSDIIENQFVPHVKSKIQAAGSIGESMLYIQTLGSLGLDSTIPFLMDIILGKMRNDTHEKLMAIHSLSDNFVDREQRERVITELLPIAENHVEEYRVREAAYMAIVSMRANATILERFALDTRRDPSPHMTALVYSSLISLAASDDSSFQEMSNVARKYLPQIRQNLPSVSNSLYFDYKTKIPDFQIGVEGELAWMSKYRSMLAAPQQMLMSLKGDFGGIDVPFFKMFTLHEDSSISASSPAQVNARDPSHKKIHEELHSIADAFKQRLTESKRDIYAYASGLNYQSFFVYDKDTRESYTRMLTDFIEHNTNKPREVFMPLNMVKYINFMDIVNLVPTAFGVPTVIEVSAPHNWLQDNVFTLQKEDGKPSNLTLDGISKLTSKTQAFMTLVMPWHARSATAGFDTESSLCLPGRMSIVFNATYPFAITRTVISPNYDQERPLLYWRSKPFTALRDQGPVSDITNVTDLITPVANLTASYNRTVVTPKDLLGLVGRMTYQGDVDFPFQQSNIMKFLRHPVRLVTLLTTPSQQDFSLAYRLNIHKSETKNISFAFVFDYGYLSKKSSRAPKENSGDIGLKLAKMLSLSRSPEAQVGMFREKQMGDFLFSLSVNCTAPNKQNRQFEIAFSGANITNAGSSEMQETVVLNLMRKGLPSSIEERKMCLIVDVTEKKAPSDNQKESQQYTTARSRILAGKDCSESEQVAVCDTRMFLNTDERNKKQYRLTSDQKAPIFNPVVQVPYKDADFYDKINNELTWTTSNMPPFYKNITNWLADMAEGFVFPHLVKNNYPNNRVGNNKAILNITRNDPSGAMDVWLHRSDSISVVQSLPMWPVFDWASPLIGSRRPYRHNDETRRMVEAEYSSGPKCFLTPEGVKTFDGVAFSRKETSCWGPVVQLHHQDESFVVMAHLAEPKADSDMEVKFIAPGLPKIEITKGCILKVNDKIVRESEELKDNSGMVIGSAKKTATSVVVDIRDKIELVLQGKNKLVIGVAEKYKEFLTSLCGDFNGEVIGELKSPSSCIYTPEKGEDFAATWIKEDQCSESDMKRVIDQAKQKDSEDCRRSPSAN